MFSLYKFIYVIHKIIKFINYVRLQEVKAQPQNMVMDIFFDDPWTKSFRYIYKCGKYYSNKFNCIYKLTVTFLKANDRYVKNDI